MRYLTQREIITLLIVLAVVVAGVFFVANLDEKELTKELTSNKLDQEKVEEWPLREVIGASVEGRSIEAYTYGSGDKHLLFVGGIHGGYEWNSVVLSFEFIDYLNENPEVVPENITVTVIPSINPDGVYKVIGKEGRFYLLDVPDGSKDEGRFNANEVDLNRNFDCNWQTTGIWRGRTIDAGSSPFSEPEAKALRDFVVKNKPDAAVFWHSQANAVYGSACGGETLPETLDIMNAYANSSGYQTFETFDAYPVTGDAEGWLASIGVPAISVELETHETVEWERNLKGVKALFNYYK